jgi:hypothetical protein
VYIREFVKTNKKTGTRYFTHRLVEGVRTPAGPRQRIVVHLGTLDLPKSEWKKLALVLEMRLSGQISLFEDDPAIAEVADKSMAHYEFNNLKKADRELLHSNQEFLAIDVNHVDTMEVRQLGPELVVRCIWEELQFEQILKDCGFNDREIALAEAVVVGRLVKPSSELAAWQWIRNRTALIEILGSDISTVGKDDVYEIADRLLEHKSAIENALRDIECRLFPEEVTLFLYDLTNTYFEGNCRANSLPQRGKSKEKRSDCPLVTLALVVDSRGFPVFSQIYKGNQSEPDTFKDIIDRLINDSEGMFTEFMPTIVMDRGIATHDNLELLKARSYPYVIIERGPTEKDYIDEFTNAKDSFEVLDNPKYPQEPKVNVK